MSWRFNVFAMLMWVEAVVLLILARRVWKQRTTVSEHAFSGLLLAQAIWLVAYGLELEGADLATIHFWAKLTYLGIVFVPIFFFQFAAAYTESHPRLFQRGLALLTFVPSVVFLLAVGTTDQNHFFWQSFHINMDGPFPFHESVPGPGFWLFTLYSYGVTVWAALLLLRAWRGRGPDVYRRNYLVLLLIWATALLTNIVVIARLWPLAAVDPAPIMLGVALVAIYTVPLGTRLFEIMPMARAAVMESLQRAVIVLDLKGRMVDLNPAAEGLLGITQRQVMGHVPAQVFPAESELLGVFASMDERVREITLAVDGKPHTLEAHSSPLYDRLNQYRGRVVLLLDISERKQSELLLEQSEQMLQALISTNEGMVFLTDFQANLLAFNAQLAVLTGLPREALYGRRVIDLLPEALARAYSEHAARVAASGQPESWLDQLDGRYIDYILYPVFNRQGVVDRFALISRDVTAYKQAELRIRESESLLKAVINASSAVLYLCDLQGTLLEFNQNLCSLVGLPREAVLNRNVFELLPAELVDEHARHFQQVVAGSRVARWLDEYQDVYIDNTLHALLDDQGQISRIAFFARDVTRYKRTELKLRDNEKVMLALLNASTEVAYLMDVGGELLAFNQNLCDLVGLAPREVQGRNVFELLPLELAESRAVPVGRVISTGQPERWIDIYNGRDMDNSVYPVTDASGRVDRVAFFSRDISDYKQAEAQIMRYAEELEVRNRDLDAFARTVAHDLKKPLQGIVGYASLIEMDFSTVAPDLKLFIDSILESADNMVEMIDNLLLMARLRNAEEVAERVDPVAVVELALHRFRQDIAERGIRLTVDEAMPALLAYGPWLEEVFANLIGNAIKYIGRTNPNPAINIRAQRVGDVVRCEVRDNGLGIKLEDQTRLFEQFKRFHHSEASGTGLGLSIVMRIVEKMGGQVGVESIPGEGSTFWFTLPAA